jgi:hypothetical protein
MLTKKQIKKDAEKLHPEIPEQFSTAHHRHKNKL